MSSLSIAALCCSWISSEFGAWFLLDFFGVWQGLPWAGRARFARPHEDVAARRIFGALRLRRVPDFRAVTAQQIIQKWTVYNLINDNDNDNVNAHCAP